MSLQSVIQGLGRLSLRCPTVTTRSLHTSQCSFRHLDSHVVPINKLPSSRNRRWVPTEKPLKVHGYTVKPIRLPSNGGRGPNGRIWNFRRGGGLPQYLRMVDWTRGGPSQGKPKEEKVLEIIPDRRMRSADLALVAAGEKKRYIVATQNMKVGDVIKSSQELTQLAVSAREGDSYPLGSLPIGTVVNCIQRFPGLHGRVSCAAGTSGQLIRKIGEKCVVRMPSKREMIVFNTCVATVGRVSNINHNQRVIGKAGANRWMGIRPKSGRWHRKTGRFGRKLRAIRKAVVYDQPPKPKPKTRRATGISLNIYRR
ncbi:hypothetical protein CAPTEDRAFT_159292 [Capitella teleta]|uniref:Uncharacterized protein n=1 Tax=Capitella teleta TaxID=283909 RepID=R7UBM7_CAPTE|nr:hypothetical protein CAPTEDRAFT_159292 [Capitella teleta]|eukprot:ELU00672.1 hypothetical protein CAPTEDRAFT_159292 [Capitella teleta]